MNVLIQSKNLVAPYNKDLAVCLQEEARKVQVNQEILYAVFFDVEKVYDRMQREGLLIKLQLIGIDGNIYNNTKKALICNFSVSALTNIKRGASKVTEM